MPVGIVSGGGSGNHMFAASLDGLTELQAGGACFMDPFYGELCHLEELGFEYALTILTTVGSRPTAERVITDAGFKTLSAKEEWHAVVLEHAGLRAGLPVGRARGLAPATRWSADVAIGEQLEIIPDYHDTTTFRHDAFVGLRDGVVESDHPAPRSRQAELSRWTSTSSSAAGPSSTARGAPGVAADVAVRDDRIVAVGTLPDAAAADRHRRDRSHRRAGLHRRPRRTPRPRCAATARSGARSSRASPSHLTAPGRVRLGAAAGRGQCAELWRSTAFAYGQPDLRARLADDRVPTSTASRARSRSTSCRWRRTSRSASRSWAGTTARRRPAEMDRMRGPHPRLDGGRRGRAQHRARLPAGGERVDRRAGRAGQGRRASTAASTPRTSATTRSASRPPIASRSRSAGARASPIRQSHESVDDETEPLLEEARQAGVDFGIDWYLYPAGSSHLLVWLRARGPDRRLRRDRQAPARRPGPSRQGRRASSRSRSRITACHRRPRVLLATRGPGATSGCRSREVAAERGTSRRRDGGRPDHRGVARRDPRLPPRDQPEEAFEAQARRTLDHPAFMVASDGVYHGALPHPRGYGCYAQVLGTFVRERGARQPRAGGPPDERPAGRALRDPPIAAGSPRAWRPTWSSSIRRPSGRGATWDEPRTAGDRHRRASWSTARSWRAMVDRRPPDPVSSFVRGTVTEVGWTSP